MWLEPLAPGRLRSILLRASFPPTATNTPILATPDRIPWCQALRDHFTARFLMVKKHNDQNTPENPFFRLQTQGFCEAWISAWRAEYPEKLDA